MGKHRSLILCNIQVVCVWFITYIITFITMLHLDFAYFKRIVSLPRCIPRLCYFVKSGFERSALRECEKGLCECENDPRCDKASEIGVTRLATVRCPTGLAFDIERQTCDWKTNVKNCDQLESKRHVFFPELDSRKHPLFSVPVPPGVQGPAWSKSRAPADWPLTWTNRPATGRAKSPTVTSSRVRLWHRRFLD